MNTIPSESLPICTRRHAFAGIALTLGSVAAGSMVRAHGQQPAMAE